MIVEPAIDCRQANFVLTKLTVGTFIKSESHLAMTYLQADLEMNTLELDFSQK